MTEDDKRNCCLLEIQETEAKYYKTLEDIEKVSAGWACRDDDVLAVPRTTPSARTTLSRASKTKKVQVLAPKELTI